MRSSRRRPSPVCELWSTRRRCCGDVRSPTSWTDDCRRGRALDNVDNDLLERADDAVHRAARGGRADGRRATSPGWRRLRRARPLVDRPGAARRRRPAVPRLVAVVEERWDDAVRALRLLGPGSRQLGGSVAQREIIEDTCCTPGRRRPVRRGAVAAHRAARPASVPARARPIWSDGAAPRTLEAAQDRWSTECRTWHDVRKSAHAAARAGERGCRSASSCRARLRPVRLAPGRLSCVGPESPALHPWKEAHGQARQGSRCR